MLDFDPRFQDFALCKRKHCSSVVFLLFICRSGVIGKENSWKKQTNASKYLLCRNHFFSSFFLFGTLFWVKSLKNGAKDIVNFQMYYRNRK